MPEGPAERGGEATRALASASAHHAESMDAAEHSGSIESVMAGGGRVDSLRAEFEASF